MSNAGLSKPGLDRMRRTMAKHVERPDLPGLVALVSRGEDLFVEAYGTLEIGGTKPMRRDTIFRIASITKPIVAAAAMILVEECKIRLDDPIEPWLPELAHRRVLRSIESELDDTVPADRAITVRDLLTYRMGFGSVMAPPGTYPIQKPIRDLGIGGDGPMLPAPSPDLDEWLRRLGSLPLIAQPGERWMYHVSGDVLGALVSRVAGGRLGAFLEERIFEPLGMRDTAFHVPPEKLDRLPGFYYRSPETDAIEPFDDPKAPAWAAEPGFESGGGGLVSTVDDYLAFCRMMLGGGRSDRARILSPATVSLMTSDGLTPANRKGSEPFFGDFSSWGFGMAVDTARREIYHSPGRFGWTGGYGTTAYTDPANDLIGILFTQRMLDSPEPPRAFTDFWNLAYGAIE